MVEDEDEVGLDEAGRRDADRVRLGQRHGRLEGRHRVVGQRPDGAAGEARHAVDRLDATPGDERAQRGQRVGRRRSLDRQVGRERVDAQRPGLDRGDPVADLEQAARADAEEAVAPEALATLDRLEEIGRPAVVEAEERPDRRLEIGVTGRPEQDRVRVRRRGASPRSG